MPWRGRASDRRGLGGSKAAWEQHRLGEAASLRILEKQRPFNHRCTKRKNLTHPQSILLFKDSSPDNRQDVHRATATRSRRSLQYFRIEASIRGTVSLFPKKQSDEQDRPRAEVFRSLESHVR